MWQPIETAPKDEQIILGAWIEPSAEAYKHGSRGYWATGVGRQVGKIWCGIIGCKPTHWMPLPTPPMSETAKERSDD